MTVSSALVWLRRDLRLTDNLAVHHAIESGAYVAVIYVLDDAILRSPRVSAARIRFMLEALNALDTQLRDYGTRLVVLRGEPSKIISAVAEALRAENVYFNHDYTPYARKRDEAVTEVLNSRGIQVHHFHDRLLLPPDAFTTGAGKPYTVYTPFKKKWRETPKPYAQPVQTDLRACWLDVSRLGGMTIPTAVELGFTDGLSLPEATPAAAQRLLDPFIRQKIFDYGDRRDILADPFTDPRNGTSSLSPYIRWGLISPRQLRQAAADAYKIAPSENARENINTWIDEIIWAEFYTGVLWHFPQVKTRRFKPEYDAVAWRFAPDDLEAWKTGQTGYPVVDAAMRQLNATGWMHNRARMIVASFLTKDLLIDWREGERYFIQKLLDGDLAANNGGWQWSAGTGTDAQPYFRIFNPVSQSEKFDPDATFIQKWVPELRGWSAKYIHAPWTMPNPPKNYPPPMVDHAAARERTLAAFKAVK